jgi:hypothetical protein
MTANGYTGSGGGGGGDSVAWADVTGKPATFPPSAHSQAASTISDSTTVGRAVLTAADAAAGRTALGAGTSSLALGTSGTTAAAGNHVHTIANVTSLQTSLDALDTRLDVLEAVTPPVLSWNGSAYVADSDARIYVGPSDPGAVPDGSVWIDTTP